MINVLVKIIYVLLVRIHYTTNKYNYYLFDIGSMQMQ